MQHHTICCRAFRTFLTIKLDQNHRCDVFLAKNATTLKWRRPDRWRFCAVILKRCREQHISPYAVSFFILTCFTFFKIVFLTCFSTKSTQAETIDLRVFYERRHSCFPFFFVALRVGQNHRCNVFLAKNCANTGVAHSRQMSLLRRHFEASPRAANPTIR